VGHSLIELLEDTVVELNNCFLIESRKPFRHESGKLPLRLVSNKRKPVPDYLPTLVDQRTTLFWHGANPSWPASRAPSASISIPTRSTRELRSGMGG
jgi:hypothetical protein